MFYVWLKVLWGLTFSGCDLAWTPRFLSHQPQPLPPTPQFPKAPVRDYGAVTAADTPATALEPIWGQAGPQGLLTYAGDRSL